MITENQLKFEERLTLDDLLEKHYSQDPIVVKPIAMNITTKEIKCYISKDLYGYMPVDDFDVVTKSNISKFSNYTYYPAIARKIGKTILACVSSIASDGKIYLSRKNVIEYNYERLISGDNIIPCEILSIDKKALYLDCGGGVQGRIFVSDAVEVFVEDLRDSEFGIGDIIYCEIIESDDETCRLSLSYQAACKVEYCEGDIITAKVRKVFENNELSRIGEADFFVEILPTHKSGVLNAYESDNLKYNDKVSCIVTSVKPSGKYKLKLISKIS